MHENAGNIGLRMDWFELIYKNLNVNVVAVAYRGYSSSSGTPSEEGIKLDVEAVVAYCKSEKMIDQKRVFLLGRSLGGAAAIYLTSKMDQESKFYFRGVVIENTFTSIPEMADHVFPFFKWIPNLKQRMIKLNWASIEEVAHIRTPIFYITGD